MQTTSDIITRALRRIGVVAADEPATSDQMRSGLDAINEIGQSFRMNGVMFDMPWLGEATDMPIDNACLAGFQTVLAARLAEEFAVAGPDASTGWQQLQAFYYVLPQSSVHELTTTPSQRLSRAVPLNGKQILGVPLDPPVWDDNGTWGG